MSRRRCQSPTTLWCGDPKYYYAYVVLGATYVATGDFTNAESSYVRAVQLYPDEENEGALAAVRKRLANDRANTK